MIKILKSVFKFLSSRLFIITLLILIQTAILFFAFYEIEQLGINIYIAFQVLSFIVTLFILNRDVNPAYKITWITFVLLVPFGGSIFYIVFSKTRLPNYE